MEFIADWLEDESVQDGIPSTWVEVGVFELEELLRSYARFEQFMAERDELDP